MLCKKMRQIQLRLSFWLQKKNMLCGQREGKIERVTERERDRHDDEQTKRERARPRTAAWAERESIDKCCDIAFAKRILQGSHFLYDKLL